MSLINICIQKITVLLVIIVSFIGFFNAILRYVGRYFHFNLSLNIFIELQWYLFSIIFLLGASYAFKKDKHIRVDVFYSNFSDKKKRISNLFGTIFLCVPFCTFLFYLSTLYFFNSVNILEQSSEPNGLPRYIIKFFIPFSFVLLLLNAIRYFVQLLKNKSNDT